MSNEYVIAEKDELTAIADSIRSVTNSTTTMNLASMAASITEMGGCQIMLKRSWKR